MDLTEHATRNRAQWNEWAAEYVPSAERNWQPGAPVTWGMWDVPESQVQLFGAGGIERERGGAFALEREDRAADPGVVRAEVRVGERVGQGAVEEITRRAFAATETLIGIGSYLRLRPSTRRRAPTPELARSPGSGAAIWTHSVPRARIPTAVSL